MSSETRIVTVESTDLAGGTADPSLIARAHLATTVSQLNEEIGHTRNVFKEQHRSVGEIHQRGHLLEWELRTQEAAHKSVSTLLDELAGLGFSWSDIAKMVGVTVPAVRKWRAGGKATGNSRRDLAALVAACELIGDKYQIEEVASWFEVPLSTGSNVTPIDLYAAGHRPELFDYASGHVDAEQILNEYDPHWREKGRSTHEVFRSTDGELAIRPKD